MKARDLIESGRAVGKDALLFLFRPGLFSARYSSLRRRAKLSALATLTWCLAATAMILAVYDGLSGHSLFGHAVEEWGDARKERVDSRGTAVNVQSYDPRRPPTLACVTWMLSPDGRVDWYLGFARYTVLNEYLPRILPDSSNGPASVYFPESERDTISFVALGPAAIGFRNLELPDILTSDTFWLLFVLINASAWGICFHIPAQHLGARISLAKALDLFVRMYSFSLLTIVSFWVLESPLLLSVGTATPLEPGITLAVDGSGSSTLEIAAVLVPVAWVTACATVALRSMYRLSWGRFAGTIAAGLASSFAIVPLACLPVFLLVRFKWLVSVLV